MRPTDVMRPLSPLAPTLGHSKEPPPPPYWLSRGGRVPECKVQGARSPCIVGETTTTH